MKICPVGGELFHVDGPTDGDRQTDMMKVIVTFHNFGNASKTVLLLILTSTLLQLTYIQNVIPGCVHMGCSFNLFTIFAITAAQQHLSSFRYSE